MTNIREHSDSSVMLKVLIVSALLGSTNAFVNQASRRQLRARNRLTVRCEQPPPPDKGHRTPFSLVKPTTLLPSEIEQDPSDKVLDWGSFKPSGSDKTLVERAQGYVSGIERALDGISGGWILSYSDLTPDSEQTFAGQAFLATNIAYAVAGLYLTQQGDPFFGFLVEVTSIASFLYHYGQLNSNGVNNLPIVRLSLLFDYACAFFSIGVGLVYLATSGGEQVMTILPPTVLALTTLGCSWVWVKGRPYMVLHGLWHFFSAYTGYVIGLIHAGGSGSLF
jgi:hypothetical protein